MVPVQPAQLRITAPITDDRPVGFFVVPGQNPADVRPPETINARRMRIFGRIRMAMVLPVVSGPPERPLLHGAASETSQDELKPAAGLVRAMGKVAVIS